MVDKVEDTQQTILKAAVEVFREKGRDGAKMQEIANRAGINKAMLHYYFRNKELLFEEVFRLTVVDFFSRINDILNSQEKLQIKINRICQVYISMAMQTPYLPVFILSEMNRNPEELFKKMFSTHQSRPNFLGFAKQIEEEVHKGNILPIHPMQLIANILSLCVFPVVSRPMMQFVGEVSDAEFEHLMEERKQLVPQLIWTSIQKK